MGNQDGIEGDLTLFGPETDKRKELLLEGRMKCRWELSHWNWGLQGRKAATSLSSFYLLPSNFWQYFPLDKLEREPESLDTAHTDQSPRTQSGEAWRVVLKGQMENIQHSLSWLSSVSSRPNHSTEGGQEGGVQLLKATLRERSFT